MKKCCDGQDYGVYLKHARRFAMYAMQRTAPGKEHVHIKMAKQELDYALLALKAARGRKGK